MPEVLPFLQQFRLIPDDPVIALILPEGSLDASLGIDGPGRKGLDAMDNTGQINGAVIRQGQRLGNNMDMVGHNYRGIERPFDAIPIPESLENHGSFFRIKDSFIFKAPGQEVNAARLLPVGQVSSLGLE